MSHTDPTKHKPSSWRDTIPIHPAAALFPRPSDDELTKLGEDIRECGVLFPIAFYLDRDGNYSLLDGISRLDAMERAGVEFRITCNKKISLRPTLRVNVGDDPNALGGSRETQTQCVVVCGDPFYYVVAANVHRRHLTAAQKRDLIAKLLVADPSKSDRQIAETAKVSPTTVGTVRKQSEDTGDVSKLDTRTDSKGRHQPASKIKTAAVKSAKTKSKGGQPEQQIDLEEAIAAADGETAAAARKSAYAIEEQQAPPPDAAAPDEDDSEAAAVEQHRQELVCQRAEFLPMLRILIDVAQYMDPSDMVAAISDETEEITPFGLGDLAGWCTQVGAELVARKKHSKEAVATGSAEPMAGDDPGPVPEFLRRGGVS